LIWRVSSIPWNDFIVITSAFTYAAGWVAAWSRLSLRSFRRTLFIFV